MGKEQSAKEFTNDFILTNTYTYEFQTDITFKEVNRIILLKQSLEIKINTLNFIYCFKVFS